MIEFMSAPEQPSRQLPVADDAIVKLTETVKITAGSIFIFDSAQFLYSSTKEIADKLVKFIFNYTGEQDFFKEGIRAEILEPGKKWGTGTIRGRFVVEFIPDGPEDNGTSGNFVSQLDDIRNINL